MTLQTRTHEHHAAAPASTRVVARLLALPRPVQVAGAAAVVIGGLFALGAPLATLTPRLALGGCLGMHLLMGHSTMHGGDGEQARDPAGSAAYTGPTESRPVDPSDRDGD